MRGLLLPFHGTSYFERSKPANLGGVQVGADLVQFSGSGIKDLPKTLSILSNLALYHSTGVKLRENFVAVKAYA